MKENHKIHVYVNKLILLREWIKPEIWIIAPQMPTDWDRGNSHTPRTGKKVQESKSYGKWVVRWRIT